MTEPKPVPTLRDPGLPAAQGLYDPSNEHDACGVGFVADMKNRRSHKIVAMGLQILENLDHRGAVGADMHAGDGCGMLTQIPHDFFAAEAERLGFALPEAGRLRRRLLLHAARRRGPRRHRGRSSPRRSPTRARCCSAGATSRPIPSLLGESVVAGEPVSRQVFVGRGDGTSPTRTASSVACTSCARSSPGMSMPGRTAARGGLLHGVDVVAHHRLQGPALSSAASAATTKDLQDERFVSALALVHQRFSTNTFPSWSLSHPYRMVAHNGEINTLRGNVNWMAARQASVTSELYGADITKLWPISYEGQSDTACFDNALEFLVQGGYSLAHAMMMLIPEAWAGNPLMGEEPPRLLRVPRRPDGAVGRARRGRLHGRPPDRRHPRPQRAAARALSRDRRRPRGPGLRDGRAAHPEESIVTKWRLQPGKMLLVDLEQGRIVSDDEMKADLAASHPYRAWLDQTQIMLEKLQPVEAREARRDVSLLDKQQAYGYTQEDLTTLLAPMGATGEEAIGSMGTDTPISALSDKAKLLYTYFKQNFAQVTNPPIDPIREELVMSLVSVHRAAAQHLRPRRQLEAQAPGSAPAHPHQRRPREDPLHLLFRGRLRHQDARHHLSGEGGRGRHGRRRWRGSPSAPKRPCGAATTSSSCRTA